MQIPKIKIITEKSKIFGLGVFGFVILSLIFGFLIFMHGGKQKIYPSAQLVSDKTIYKSYDNISFRLLLSPEESSSKGLVGDVFAAEELGIEPLLERDGVEEDIKVDVKEIDDDQYILSISPPKAFTPGKYTLKTVISNSSGENTITQDFLWGVLALNPNKAIYKPGETSKISLAVLDERGAMVCDALLRLEINAPDGQATTLSTEDGSIKVNRECESYEYTLTPDYETRFKTNSAGEYKLTLTAETKNGTYTIEDSIRVADHTPFEIERTSATRAYPFNEYPMLIDITANEDFKGEVYETVPSDFGIIETHQDDRETDYAAFITEEDEYRTLKWDVDFKKGQKYTLSYIYDTPDISPEFYLLGNFKLSNGFSEKRLWQIANDATGTIVASGDITTTNWTSGTCTSNLWGCIDEGTTSPTDSDYIQTTAGVTNGDYVFTSTASPGNVGTVTAFTITARAIKTGGRAATLDVFYSTDGSDPSITIGTQATLTTSLVDYTFTATSLSLTKTQIDALRIKFRGNAASTGSGGATAVQVTASQTDITYNIATISVSGNVYNAGTSTALTECDADGGTHELSLRTEGVTYTTSCSSADGSYTFTGVIPGSAGTGIIIWIDDAQAPETDGAIAIRYDGSGNSTSNTFYDDTVTITSDDTNGVTNANMDTYDNGNDADIPYTVTTNNLTVNSGYELLVKIKSGVAGGSMVFDAGGTVETNTTGGDLHVDDNSLAELDTATNTIGRDILIDTGATLRVNENTTVGGGDITATGTLTTTAGTPTVTVRGTGSISGAGSKTFYNLTIGDGTTATTTLSDSATANNNVSVGTGSTFNINANLTVTGSLTNTTTGIINHTANSPVVTVSGTSIGGGSGAITFYRLQKAGAGTTTFSGSGTNTINDTLDATAGTLTLSTNNVITVAGNVSASTSATLNQNTALTINGGSLLTSGTGVVNTTAGTGTVTINGSGGTIGGGGTVTIYNLALGGTGTQTLASSTTSSTDVSVPAGKTLELNNQNLTVNGGDLTTTTTGSITCSGCSAGTVTMSSTGSLGGGSGAITFYNLTTSGTGTTTFSGSGTNSALNNITVGAGTTLNINSSITVTGNFTNTTTGIIGTTAGTPTVTVSGTSIGGGTSTGAITFYNLIKSGAGTTTFANDGANSINNDLTVSNGTLTQSDTLTVTNDVSVATGVTFNTNANLNINGGDLATAGTGVVNTTAGSGTVTISGTGNIGGGGTVTVYNLAVNGSQTAASTITANNSITVGSAGTFTISGRNINSAGSFTNTTTGVISCSGTTGTVTMTGGGTLGSGSGDITFCNLATSTTGTTTFSGSGTNTVNNDVTVGTGTTLNINSSVTIAGNFNNTTTGIIGTTAGTPTITMTGSSKTLGGGSGAITLHNLSTTGTASVTFSGGGTNTVNSNVSVGTGTTLNINSSVSIAGSLTNTTTGIINTTAGTPTVTMTGTGSIGGGTTGAVTFYNLATSGTGTTTFTNSGTNTISNNVTVGAGTTLNLNSSISITGNLTNTTTGIIGTSAGTPTVTVSGTSIGGGSGAITLHNLTKSGAGTTTFSGSGTNIINNDLTVSNGTLTQSNTLTVTNDVSVATGVTFNTNANLNINGGDLATAGTGVVNTTAGSGTVTISGTGNIGGGGTVTVYNLTVSGAQTLQSTATTNNSLSVATGDSLALNNQNISSAADFATTGTGTITCSGCSAGTVTLSGTGNIGGGGTVTVYNLTSSSGTQTLSSATTALNDLTANGTINGSSNMTVNGTVVGTGTINMSGGTFEQRVAAAENFGTTSGVNNWTFSTLLFSNSSGADRTITTQTGGSGGITASTLLQLGKGGDTNQTILDAGNRTWTLSGTSGTPFNIVSPSTSSSLTASTSTMNYTGANAGGDTTIQDTTYNNLTINASDTFVLEASPLNINGDLTVTTGTLSLSSNSMTVGSSGVANSGDISVAGTLTQSASGTTTIRTSSGGASSIGGAGTLTFYNLTIAPAVAAEPTITLGTGASQTITVSNDLTIGNGSNAVTVTGATNSPALDVNGSVFIAASGTLTAPGSAGSFNVAVNFTNNGIFNHNSGTVTFDTAGTSILNGSGSPAITFSGLTITTAGKIVQFTVGKTFRINGLWTVTGTSGNQVRLVSTIDDSQWTINHQGTESMSYIYVKDSACDGTSTEIGLNTTSSNAGNNGTCWVFQIGKRVVGNTKIKGDVRFK